MQTNTVPRGLQAAHAESSIPELIKGVNAAFSEFRAANDTRLDTIERQLEQDATLHAAHQMGNFASTKPASKFAAHYAAKPDYEASNEPISTADFLRGVAGMRTTEAVRAALSTGTGTAGGYTVPSRLAPQILDQLQNQSATLQAGARIELIEPASTYTFACTDALPTASWRTEAGNVQESDPGFRAVVAAPKSLAFYFKLSRELLQDGKDLDRALNVVIAQAFAGAIDRAGLIGSGLSPEPRGIANTVGVNVVTNGTNGASLTSYAKLLEAYASIVSSDHNAPTALIAPHRDVLKLAGLADTLGQPLNRPPVLNAMQMIGTSRLPINLTAGTSTDTSQIIVGDFAELVYVTRENLTIGRLNEHFALTGEVAFVCHARVDVGVLRPKAFAVISGVRA